MRHMLPALFALIVTPLPGLAETPEAILSEAATIAMSLDEMGDRRRALEEVIEAHAQRGDAKSALALIQGEAEPAILGSLWIAAVKGTIAGPGPVAALAIAEGIPEPDTRGWALGYIARAQLAAGDIPAAHGTLALIGTGPIADGVRADIVKALLQAGQEAEARAVAATIADPQSRDYANLDLLRHRIQEGQIDAALADLAGFGTGPIRDLAQIHLIRALADAGRLPEAEAILATASEPTVQVRGQSQLAIVAASAGDLDQARLRIASIPDPLEFQSALTGVTRAIVTERGVEPALAFLASVSVDPEATHATRDRTIFIIIASLLHEDEPAFARELLAAITDPATRDDALASFVRVGATDDLETARTDLADITNPRARFHAILAILSAAPDDALAAEALSFARAEADPVWRATYLAQTATALSP